MISTRRALLFLVVALLVTASPVLAGGGGGTKRNGTIRFVNQSAVQVGVTTNANGAAIKNALTAASASEFTAAGGKILNAGGAGSYSVSAGTYTIGAANFSVSTLTPITESITVSKGQTVVVFIQTATSGSNTIQFSGKSSTSTSGS